VYINFPSYYFAKKLKRGFRVDPVTIAVIMILVAIASLATGYWLGHDSGEEPPTKKVTKNATQQDILNATDYQEWLKSTEEAKQKAYEELAKYTQMLISDFTDYDFQKEGSLGNIDVDVYGPDKIYGFSAFPVQIKITVGKDPVDWAYVHLYSVKVYVINTETGEKKWERTWSWSGNETPLLNGKEFVLGTVLKTPDNYAYSVRDAISYGAFTKDLYDKLINAVVPRFEIGVEVSAKKEMWEAKTADNETACQELAGGSKYVYDSNSKTCYVFQGMTDISFSGETTSAYLHTTGVPDFARVGNLTASAPRDILKTEYAEMYQIFTHDLFGALSNFRVIPMATPVHVMDSTARWKFIFRAVPDYFDPLIKVNGKAPVFIDDFRIMVMRITNASNWEVAYTKYTQMSDFTTAYDLDLPVKYTATNDTIDYLVAGLAYLELKRDDGIKIPIWYLVVPHVTVLENIDVALTDARVQPLTTLTDKTELTESDLETAMQLIEAMKGDLEKKKLLAEELKNKGELLNAPDAITYAENAIKSYSEAEKGLDKYLEAIKSGDKQMALNWLNYAKKMEDAGDFYLDAAKKAANGLKEQAQWSAEQAKKIESLAEQYAPHIDILGALSNIKLPFGLELSDVIVIIIAAIVAWVGKQFLGPIGVLLGLVIIVGWFSGKMAGGAIDWLINKIKFW